MDQPNVKIVVPKGMEVKPFGEGEEIPEGAIYLHTEVLKEQWRVTFTNLCQEQVVGTIHWFLVPIKKK